MNVVSETYPNRHGLDDGWPPGARKKAFVSLLNHGVWYLV